MGKISLNLSLRRRETSKGGEKGLFIGWWRWHPGAGGGFGDEPFADHFQHGDFNVDILSADLNHVYNVEAASLENAL
jgi:hypothetical protein